MSIKTAQVVGIAQNGVIGFDGELVFDTTKPDGTMRKLMDVSRLASLGWKAQISLEEGLAGTYAWFLLEHAVESRKS